MVSEDNQVSSFLLTDMEWKSLLARHSGIKQLVPEDNQVSSFLLTDTEWKSFLARHSGIKVV
jgi:hypothetical protein